MNHIKYIYTLLIFMQSLPMFAQWEIKTKNISEQSHDRYISLNVNFPILVGNSNPSARKRINHALGQISNVDKLIADAKKMILYHKKTLNTQPNNKNYYDTDDYPYEEVMHYTVGTNNGKLFSLCFNGYSIAGGGVNANLYWETCTFDASTGRKINLDDIFIRGYEIKLFSISKPYLKKISDELSYDWEQCLKDSKFHIYFKNKLVVIGFSQGNIGPRASGIVEIEIPLKKLNTILKRDNQFSHLF